MEIIKVNKEVKTYECVEIEVEDTKNCFFKGNDVYRNLTEYLGIWIDNHGLKTVSILNNSAITVDCSLNVNNNTIIDIEYFLKNHKSVQIISKEEFRSQLNRLIGILNEE